jgi:RNA polymerase sigma factor (sigma-70 family)
MAKGRWDGVLRHLRRAALLCDGADLTDGELLERYLVRRDEAAFESLLRRHGPMVLGVCRRVLCNEADAHDAFQATFLVFVRKAGSIVPRARVGNWLYGVAHRTALKARAMNRLRRDRERRAALPPEPPPANVLQDLLARLDDALSRLPAKYRAPVVLCHLEEKSIQEAARQLGCPPGTVASRLARAREMLGKRLAGRGAPAQGAALTSALAHGAAPAVPASLNASTLQAAAAAGQALTAGLISPNVAALTETVVQSLGLAKKAVAAALLTATLLAGGALIGYPAPSAGPNGSGHEGLSAPAPRPTRAMSGADQLRGSWLAVSGERNGEAMSDRDLKRWRALTFMDGKFTREGAERVEGTYAFRPHREPKEIDLSTGFMTWKGVCELKGTTLKLALQSGDERPPALSSRDALLIVFEKEK